MGGESHDSARARVRARAQRHQAHHRAATALPFARFRGKLVAVLLGMTLIPAVLVLLVGSELIRNSVDRWFNAPVEEVLTAADLIASDYYRDRQVRVTRDAERVAAALATTAFDGADFTAVRDRIQAEVLQGRVKMIEIYRVTPGTQTPEATAYIDVAAHDMPRGYARAVADRMASRAAVGEVEPPTPEQLPGGGELIRAAAVVRRAGSSQPVAIVVASDFSWAILRDGLAGFRTRTKITVSCACCGSRSPASTCHSF